MKIVAIQKNSWLSSRHEFVGCRYRKRKSQVHIVNRFADKKKKTKWDKEGLNMKSYGERESEFSTRQRALLLQQAFEDMPSKIALFKKCFLAEASPRSAIKGHCLICNWGNHAAIRNCSADACPLWQYRPFTDVKYRKPAAN